MKRKRWLLLALKIAIVVLVVWGVHRTLDAAIQDLRQRDFHFHAGWLTLSGGLYILGMLPAGLFWQRVMRGMGQQARLWETMRAYLIGHLGKYVPGKAMVVILRTGLIRGDRVDTAVAAVSVFIETLTMMAVGSFMSAIILLLWYPGNAWYAVIALGVMVVSGLPTLPAFFKLVARVTVVGRKYPRAFEQVSQLDYRTLVGGWLAMALGWVLMGLSLWTTLRGMGVTDLRPFADLPLCTAVVALAVVAGFLSFTPAGLLVRDFVLTALLAPQLGTDGEGKALAAAILLRLVWLLSEVLISGILYFAGGRRWSPRPRIASVDPLP